MTQQFIIPPRTTDGNDIRKFFQRVCQLLNQGMEVDNSLASSHLSADQTGLVSTEWTKALLNTESFDTDSNFSSYKYICPVAGKYQVNSNVTFKMAADHLVSAVSEIRKNNVMEIRGSRYHGPAISWFGSVGSGVVDCAAGDYLELWAYSATDAGTADLEGVSTFMNVYLIART